MSKNKLLLLLALLLTAATGAWAQTETLLTTITNTGENASFTSGSKTFDDIATVTFSAEVHNDGDNWGWYNMESSLLTVAGTNGYTITRVKFYSAQYSAFDEEAPFEATVASTHAYVNGTDIGQWGVTKIEVYGYEGTAEPAATGYTVSMKDGVKDAGKWTVKVGDGQAQALPIGGLKGDGSETVTLQYTGRLKVKGVKATSDEEPAEAPTITLDNTTTAWTAGKYAVPAGGLTYSAAITVSGDVTLTLTDGETLTLNSGLSLASGATLTVEGTGTMNVNGTNESTASTVAGTGTLVLTSGTLTVKGGNGGSVGEYDDEVTKSAGGIAINGAVTVSGGTLTATGGNGGAGGSGCDSRAGAGAAAISGDVTVSGGTLAATGGNGGSFSGSTLGPDGYAGAGGTAIVGSVTITDGTVTATGGNGGSITISNFAAELYAGNGGAAIGGNATLTGGTLNKTNGTNGTVGGSGNKIGCSAGTGGKAVAGTVTDNRN